VKYVILIFPVCRSCQHGPSHRERRRERLSPPLCLVRCSATS
jgi:hypothetical protein